MGTLNQTAPQPGQAATPVLALARHLWWSCPSPCMPMGLLWYVKVGGQTVCLLNLANKCHPAKPPAALLPLLGRNWGGTPRRQWAGERLGEGAQAVATAWCPEDHPDWCAVG